MLTQFFETDLQLLYVTVDDNKVIAVDFDEPPYKGQSTAEDQELMQKVAQQMSEYFEGTRTVFDLPLKAEGTAFQQRVWMELQNIPYGQAISYQELAGRIGNPKAVRAVGQANRRNPLPIIIPCHRVIGKDKKLVGYAGSQTTLKEWLLTHEKFLCPTF